MDKSAEMPGSGAAGHAALSICESLLIAMRELNVITEKDVRNILESAATKHQKASSDSDNPELHKEAAALIERIIAGRNSLP